MNLACYLLRQWDAGRPVWSWRTGDDEHLIHHLAFEILRWFLMAPSDVELLERFVTVGEEGFVADGELSIHFKFLIERLEALPPLRNLQPYTATQMALALSLARTLFRNEIIPARRRIQVRRLTVVAA
jgi:hypothetical protein